MLTLREMNPKSCLRCSWGQNSHLEVERPELTSTPTSLSLNVRLIGVLPNVQLLGGYLSNAQYAALVSVERHHPFNGPLLQAASFIMKYISIVI